MLVGCPGLLAVWIGLLEGCVGMLAVGCELLVAGCGRLRSPRSPQCAWRGGSRPMCGATAPSGAPVWQWRWQSQSQSEAEVTGHSHRSQVIDAVTDTVPETVTYTVTDTRTDTVRDTVKDPATDTTRESVRGKVTDTVRDTRTHLIRVEALQDDPSTSWHRQLLPIHCKQSKLGCQLLQQRESGDEPRGRPAGARSSVLHTRLMRYGTAQHRTAWYSSTIVYSAGQHSKADRCSDAQYSAAGIKLQCTPLAHPWATCLAQRCVLVPNHAQHEPPVVCCRALHGEHTRAKQTEGGGNSMGIPAHTAQ